MTGRDPYPNRRYFHAPLPANSPNIPTLADYVLGVSGEPGHVPPGDFYRKLLAATFQADRINRSHLERAFPTLVQMVSAYKDDLDGVERLRHAVKTGEWYA